MFSALLFQIRRQNAWSDWYGWTVRPRRRSTYVYSAYKTAVNPGQDTGCWFNTTVKSNKFHCINSQVSVVVVVSNNTEGKDMLKTWMNSSHSSYFIFDIDKIFRGIQYLELIILLKLMRTHMSQSFWTAVLNLLNHHICFYWNVCIVCIVLLMNPYAQHGV